MRADIDIDKLTAYISSQCMFAVSSDSGIRHCRIKMDRLCNMPEYQRDDCPEDCPRRQTSNTRCELSGCKHVKKILKSLTVDKDMF